MDAVIKREDTREIVNKLNESKNNLIRGNIFSCISCFREVLEKMLTTKMLASDEKDLNKEINAFQTELAASKIFREVYGPVSFRDNDLATSLDFMKQLIQIKEEETRALLADHQDDLLDAAAGAGAMQDKKQQVKVTIEKGDYAVAQEIVADDEELIFTLVQEYNSSGIEHRRAGRYDEAMSEFKKALVVSPRDEGLYYNIARVFVAKKDWNQAAVTIGEGLTINPNFGEGIKLLKYIRENEPLTPS